MRWGAEPARGRPSSLDPSRSSRPAGSRCSARLLVRCSRPCATHGRRSLPAGPLLTTVPSLARRNPHLAATDFWRWTPGGLAELLGRVGMPARVAGYVNVLAGVAALWGLSVEDLSAQELDVNDPCSPLVAYAYAAKPA